MEVSVRVLSISIDHNTRSSSITSYSCRSTHVWRITIVLDNIDTGAMYTIVPRHVAEKLDLEVVDKRKFKIASGEVVEYPVRQRHT